MIMTYIDCSVCSPWCDCIGILCGTRSSGAICGCDENARKVTTRGLQDSPLHETARVCLGTRVEGGRLFQSDCRMHESCSSGGKCGCSQKGNERLKRETQCLQLVMRETTSDSMGGTDICSVLCTLLEQASTRDTDHKTIPEQNVINHYSEVGILSCAASNPIFGSPWNNT